MHGMDSKLRKYVQNSGIPLLFDIASGRSPKRSFVVFGLLNLATNIQNHAHVEPT